MVAAGAAETKEVPFISVPIAGWIALTGSTGWMVTSGPVEWIVAVGAAESMVLACAEMPNVVPVSCRTAFAGDVTGDTERSDLLGLPLRRLAGEESGTAGTDSIFGTAGTGSVFGTAGTGSVLASTGSTELSAGTSNLLNLEISKSFTKAEPG
jgi:hypothetical protein